MTRMASSSSWSEPLESWCTRHFGSERLAADDHAQFGPFEAHKRERFFDTPVVLFVLPSTTASLHLALAKAADLIRVSTAGFRAVIVTDMYRSPAIDACDWPVEQLVPELAWQAHQDSNWLEYAAESVVKAQQYFGASYVLAPDTLEAARAALRLLARSFNCQDAVTDNALQLLAAEASEPEASDGSRGGWSDVSVGEPAVRTIAEPGQGEVTVSMTRGAGRGVLLCIADSATSPLLSAANDIGMSTAVFAAAEHSSTESVRMAVRAAADGLAFGGPILVGEELSGCTAGDGVIHGQSPEKWLLRVPDIAVIRFNSEQASQVFAEVRRALQQQSPYVR